MQGRALIAIGGLVVIAIMAYSYYRYGRPAPSPSWNGSAMTATYLGAQLREIDPANVDLALSYELQNNTDTDYRLADAPGYIFMSRLAADGSLSSQEEVRLGYSTFLPARQRSRVTLELRRRFDWPPANDPALQDKLKSFVNDRLSGVDEFVLFDQAERWQIEFPRGWQEFKLASITRN